MSDGYQKTLERLKIIQSHLQTKPRSGRLSGKVAIVTGVGSLTGIGRAVSLQFAHEGIEHLYVLDFDSTNLPDLKSTIQSKYPDVKVTTFEGDAADEKLIEKICNQTIEEEGRLDIFHANAAIATAAPLISTDAEDFTETMRVNVISCFLAVKFASPLMQITSSSKPHSNGSIILTASVAGLRSGAGSVDYSASKAAVISIAQTSSWQLARTYVRVNAICPGLIETGMTLPTFEMARERGTAGKIGQLNPTGRYGVAEEISNAVLFLASDDSSYVNGTAIPICGGLSSSHPTVPGRFH